MISILIITNLICWLPVCRKTDWLCYEFLGGKQFCCWNQFPRASYLPSSGRIRNQFKSKLRATPQKWAIELMPIYRRFDLILLVVLSKLNEVIQCILILLKIKYLLFWKISMKKKYYCFYFFVYSQDEETRQYFLEIGGSDADQSWFQSYHNS